MWDVHVATSIQGGRGLASFVGTMNCEKGVGSSGQKWDKVYMVSSENMLWVEMINSAYSVGRYNKCQWIYELNIIEIKEVTLVHLGIVDFAATVL